MKRGDRVRFNHPQGSTGTYLEEIDELHCRYLVDGGGGGQSYVDKSELVPVDTTWQEEAAHISAGLRERIGLKLDSAELAGFLALELCGEVGELANKIKKMWRGDIVTHGELASEIADARITLRNLAAALGMDEDEEAAVKIPMLYSRWPFLMKGRGNE